MISLLGAAAAASSPTTITASAVAPNRSPFAKPGTTVNASGLGNRVYVSHSNGFALWTYAGVTYPACTANGGRKWTVCGPHLHVPAANAPNVVTQVGAKRGEYFAFGGPNGAESIVVSTNHKTWYRAYMPGVPYAVAAAENGQLFAFVAAGRSVTEWTSSNGGKSWKKA